MEDAYSSALRQAALEAFEGRYETEEISKMVYKIKIIDEAIILIVEE